MTATLGATSKGLRKRRISESDKQGIMQVVNKYQQELEMTLENLALEDLDQGEKPDSKTSTDVIGIPPHQGTLGTDSKDTYVNQNLSLDCSPDSCLISQLPPSKMKPTTPFDTIVSTFISLTNKRLTAVLILVVIGVASISIGLYSAFYQTDIKATITVNIGGEGMEPSQIVKEIFRPQPDECPV